MTVPAPKSQSYSERIRLAMRTSNNPAKAPLTLRQLAQLTGYSYEHHRKVVNGMPVGSREFSDRLCKALGLNPEEMWELATVDKVKARFGMSFLAQYPQDSRLAAAWPLLTVENRERITQVAIGLLHQQDAHVPEPTLGSESTPKAHSGQKTMTPPPSKKMAPEPIATAWMTIREVQYYLRFPSLTAVLQWVEHNQIPVTPSRLVSKVNVDRVASGALPFPHDAFDAKAAAGRRAGQMSSMLLRPHRPGQSGGHDRQTPAPKA